MKKQLVAAGIATAVGVTGLTSFTVANAATDDSNTSGPTSSLVEAIASKFHLKASDVQTVFDEQRAKMEEEREARITKEVAQLVSDGKITQDQADKINAKRAELQKERDAAKDSNSSKTHDEIKAERDAERVELEAWAKENGIDTQYLRLVIGSWHGFGGPSPNININIR